MAQLEYIKKNECADLAAFSVRVAEHFRSIVFAGSVTHVVLRRPPPSTRAAQAPKKGGSSVVLAGKFELPHALPRGRAHLLELCRIRGQMVPPFDDAVFNGEVGEVVGPINTLYGGHLIWVTERTTA